MKTKIKLLLIFLFCIIPNWNYLRPVAQGPRTFYVSYDNGNDANNCTLAQNIATPKRGPNSVINNCSLTAGDIVYIRQRAGGAAYPFAEVMTDYPPNIADWPSGGIGWSAGQYITIAGYPGERPIFTDGLGVSYPAHTTAALPDYIRFENITWDSFNSDRGTFVGATVGDHYPVDINWRFVNTEFRNVHNSQLIAVGASRVEFYNVEVHGNTSSAGHAPTDHCMYMTGDYLMFVNSRIYTCAGFGWHGYDGYHGNDINNNMIIGNIIWDTGNGLDGTGEDSDGGPAIMTGYGDNNLVANNIVFGAGPNAGITSCSAIVIQGPSSAPQTSNGNKVINNLIMNVGICSYPLAVNAASATNSLVANNIVYNSYWNLLANTGTNTTFTNNMCDEASTNCSITASPTFVNYTGDQNGNYRLTPTSRGVDEGTNQSAYFTTDFDGTTRSDPWDIGPFEIAATIGCNPTCYVDDDGDNGNAGTISSPWQTIPYALSQISSGEHLYLRAGTYAAFALNDLAPVSGANWATKTIIEAYPGETISVGGITPCVSNGVTIQYIEFKGTNKNFNFNRPVTLYPCTTTTTIGHLRFDNIHFDTAHGAYGSSNFYLGHPSTPEIGADSEIINSTSENAGDPTGPDIQTYHGLYIAANRVLVQDVIIDDTTGNCLNTLSSDSANTTGIIYERVSMSNCGTAAANAISRVGCMTLRGTGNIVRNSLCYDSVGGILVTNDNFVYNTTIVNNGVTIDCGAFCVAAIYISAGSPTIKNNILWGNQTNTISAGGTQSNNLCASGAGCSVTSDPAFTDGTGPDYDFSLGAKSPAVDVAETLVGFNTDYIETSRDQGGEWDIGAYERIGSAPPASGGAVRVVNQQRYGILAADITLQNLAQDHDAGNSLICWIGISDPANGIFLSSVTNTGLDTWHIGTRYRVNGNSVYPVYAYNINGSAVDQILFTWSEANSYRSSDCVQVEGLDYSNGNPFLDSRNDEGIGTDPSTPELQIGSNINAFVFMYGIFSAQNFEPRLGYTGGSFAIIGDGTTYWGDGYKFTVGNETPSGTQGNNYWGLASIAFLTNEDDGIVHEGEDLQSALDNAVCNTPILLEAGATFTGNFILRKKNCTALTGITITTDTPGNLPADGTNIIGESVFDFGTDFRDERTDAQWKTLFASMSTTMPKLTASNTLSTLYFEPEANYYTIKGIEISSDNGSLTADGGPTYIVEMGSTAQNENLLTDFSFYPTNVTFDQVYVHGGLTSGTRNGISCNGINVTVKDSVVDEIHQTGSESHGIACAAGTNNINVLRNFVAAGGINIFFGGGTPYVPNAVADGINVIGNFVHKYTRWFLGFPDSDGINHNIKNNLEFKNAKNILAEGNIFNRNIGGQGQSGYSVLFTSLNDDGTCTWCEVTNAIFRNNIIRHTGAILQLSGFNGYSRLDGSICTPPGPNPTVSDWTNEGSGLDPLHLYSETGNGGIPIVGGLPTTVTISGGALGAPVSRSVTEISGGYPYGRSYITIDSSIALGSGMTVTFDPNPPTYGAAEGCSYPQKATGLLIENLLAYDIDYLTWPANHTAIAIGKDYANITINHVTVDNNGSAPFGLATVAAVDGEHPTGYDQMPGLVIKNSFFRTGYPEPTNQYAEYAYGVVGDNDGQGTTALETYTPDGNPYVWSRIVMGTPTGTSSPLPASTSIVSGYATFNAIFTNYAANDFTVPDGSIYKAGGIFDADDDTDIGANIAAIQAALNAEEEPPPPVGTPTFSRPRIRIRSVFNLETKPFLVGQHAN